MMRPLGERPFAAALVCATLAALAAAWKFPAEDSPQAAITNGLIRVKLYLPDARDGYYRGTRFDWAGVIGSLEYDSHNYYGPWFDRVDPAAHDFRYEGTEIIASLCSGISGPAEEYQTNGSALGWDEAKVGGTFVKIGVGVLRKDDARYDFVKQYEIIDHGKWAVEKRPDSVEFIQTLTDPFSGYGYVYHKIVRLVAGKPEMVLEHQLRNIGRRPIRSTVYNHNFLVLDKQPPGPDFTIAVPFLIHPARAFGGGLAEIRGQDVVYLRPLRAQDVVETRLQGFGASPNDYEIRIENRRVRAGMKITGNRPLADLNLWSIRTVLAMEPFVAMTIDPGGEFTWTITYDYYSLPPDAKQKGGREAIDVAGR